MFSIGQLLVLKPGCEQEYKRRHDELWPDLADAMRRAGVNMAIYLHENLLFLFATAASKSLWDALDRDPVTPRWDAYMSDILVSDENGRPLVKDLPLMFGFGEFRHTSTPG
jgi:L-rhamnose mutarotase